jgi:hypothetical protein
MVAGRARRCDGMLDRSVAISTVMACGTMRCVVPASITT